MSKLKSCRWNCGRKTDRRCGICIYCCDERDELNRQIDAGTAAYIPPDKRPGHRFYERKQISEERKAGLTKARASKHGKFSGQMAPGGTQIQD